MKKLLLVITLISVAITQAQIVDIPDYSFKSALLNASVSNNVATDLFSNPTAIDTNNDGEIQVSEAENISYLDISNNSIYDLTGIEYFINLSYIDCSWNQLSSVDFSNNTQLTHIDASSGNSGRYLDQINISNCPLLEDLYLYKTNLNFLDISNNNYLIALDISNNPQLQLSNDIGDYDLYYYSCGNNGYSNLDVSNNTELEILYCNNNNLSNIDLSSNSNLVDLRIYSNQINSLDVSNNENLRTLFCSNNNLISLDVSNNLLLRNLMSDYNNLTSLVLNNIDLRTLNCSYNPISILDLSNCTKLTDLYCTNTQINTLELSLNPYFNQLGCSYNPNLTYINLKNGNNENFNLNYSHFTDLPNLENICVDELNTNLTSFITTEVNHSVTFTEYCSFEPAQSNIITGNIHFDLDTNGCDSSDLTISNLLINTNNGIDSFGTFTQDNGNYTLYTNEGNFTTEVTTNLPNYFTVNPSAQTNTFTDFNNTFTADFCITPNQTVNDVNITLIPTSQARPGFNTTYKIVYKNVGTTQLNGSISLDFNDTMLSFLNASETSTLTGNTLTFNYSNLNPFETRTIDLEFNILATVNIGDVLNFSATINPIAGDYTTDDNIFTLNQIVVGSYDPNDITCLEGDDVWLGDVDKYLHYVIRFQNKGTASAINIVVANNLDSNLDWSTLQLESSSHTNRVAIKNGNEIEFIFENINLPDENTDEPGSHGFIAYKIKPKAAIALGDIIPNQADIFFDYNEAVPTNTATTTIIDVSAVNNNTLLDFSVYPTPTENILNINSKTEIIKIEIFSKLGQLIKNVTKNNIDISNLTQGLYFIKVTAVNGNSGVKKIVKK